VFVRRTTHRVAALALAAVAFAFSPACGEAVDSDQCERWSDCDGDPANGCETPVGRDENNCGACGIVCGDAQANPSCVDGSCALNCHTGWEDCDGDLANGCERPIDDDPQSCGGCDLACPAAVACVASDCVPTALHETARVGSVAAAGGIIFFADSVSTTVGTVYSVDGEGEVTTIASADLPSGLAADDTWVYWSASNEGAVRRTTHDATGTIQDLATGLEEPGRLALHEGWLYVTTQGPPGGLGELLRIAADGGSPEVLASDLETVFDIAVDDSGIYLGVVDQGVFHVPLAGGPKTDVATVVEGIVHVGLDDDRVYWSVHAEGGGLFSAPKGGGPATTLWSDWVLGFALDGNVAAFSTGHILRLDLVSGEADTISTAGGGLVLGIVIDDDRVLWGDANAGGMFVAPW
jgi:hypothetical protein